MNTTFWNARGGRANFLLKKLLICFKVLKDRPFLGAEWVVSTYCNYYNYFYFFWRVCHIFLVKSWRIIKWNKFWQSRKSFLRELKFAIFKDWLSQTLEHHLNTWTLSSLSWHLGIKGIPNHLHEGIIRKKIMDFVFLELNTFAIYELFSLFYLHNDFVISKF